MPVSRKLIVATYEYRADGGHLYKLAIQHDISPSQLSATLKGRRRCDWDPRIVAIGVQLGLTPEECFEAEPEAAAS